MQVAELLDRAKVHTGSDKATAAALEVSAQRLSDWRNGSRPMPITMQVRACDAARMNEGEQMRYVWEVVRERVGKGLHGAALGAAVLIASTAEGFALLAASRGDLATMYIRLNPRARLG